MDPSTTNRRSASGAPAGDPGRDDPDRAEVGHRSRWRRVWFRLVLGLVLSGLVLCHVVGWSLTRTETSPSGRFIARVTFSPLASHRIVLSDRYSHRSYVLWDDLSWRPNELPDPEEWEWSRSLVWDREERGFLYIRHCAPTGGGEERWAQAFEMQDRPPFAHEITVAKTPWALQLLRSIPLDEYVYDPDTGESGPRPDTGTGGMTLF